MANLNGTYTVIYEDWNSIILRDIDPPYRMFQVEAEAATPNEPRIKIYELFQKDLT